MPSETARRCPRGTGSPAVLNWCFGVSMPGTLKSRSQASQPAPNRLLSNNVRGCSITKSSWRRPSPTGRKTPPQCLGGPPAPSGRRFLNQPENPSWPRRPWRIGLVLQRPVLATRSAQEKNPGNARRTSSSFSDPENADALGCTFPCRSSRSAISLNDWRRSSLPIPATAWPMSRRWGRAAARNRPVGGAEGRAGDSVQGRTGTLFYGAFCIGAVVPPKSRGPMACCWRAATGRNGSDRATRCSTHGHRSSALALPVGRGYRLLWCGKCGVSFPRVPRRSVPCT